ncbi:MAG: dihydroxyacetone kinase phosphoryl donor subunit DhaM [Candidatus Limnocylindrales bacterium]
MTASDNQLVGLVLVSHSAKLAEGTAELAFQMAGPDVRLLAVGGAPDGTIGTDPDRIATAIRSADSGAGVLVICDLGSAILATESAVEMLDGALAARVRLSGGPFVEGAVIASVQASIGQSLDDVRHAAEEARDLDKGVGR